MPETPGRYRHIDQLLARNRKRGFHEMTVEELANAVHEMRTEVLAICEAVDERRLQRRRLRMIDSAREP